MASNTAAEPLIRVENLRKSFGSHLVLKDINFEVSQGEVVTIIGASGSGKSTLLRCMNLLESPDSGHIWFHGEDLAAERVNINRLRQDIGMVFQDFKLLENKTVFENVSFAMEVVRCSQKTIDRQVPQMLSVMGIEDKANNYPSELSAGEQQRVAIARAIINNPRILIADEPTGNLDPETAWEIMQLLELVNKRGTTVVMVTHARDIVNRMNKRVIAIDQGTIIRDSRGGDYGFDD